MKKDQKEKRPIIKRVLSYGGGVNSTAIIILHKQGKIEPLDLVIFSDTESELPETYRYIEIWIKPLCESIGLEFVTVGKGSLFKDYWDRNIIPFRMFRSCTDKYKVRPITKYLKQRFGDDYTIVMGIDYGERRRAKRIDFEYPLIDREIDREGCKDIIRSEGFEVPIKSGCFFCPFTKVDNWKKLLTEHKDLFMKAEAFEKNCRKYPDATLTAKPLEQLRIAIEQQRNLADFNGIGVDMCEFCHE